jgi:hypothetical protein
LENFEKSIFEFFFKISKFRDILAEILN